MKLRTLAVVLMGFVAMCGTAGAFGLPSLGGGSKGASADPDGFLAKATKSETLVNKSADQLFALVASKEELAKVEALRAELAKATSTEEKNAIMQKIQSTEMAVLGQAKADKELVARAAALDDKKKKQGQDALYNFALGTKLAADLVPEGQNLVSSMKSNPMMATKVGSVLDAVNKIGGIATGGAKVVSALPPVFSAAKIDVKLPTSSSAEPVAMAGGM